MTDWSENILKEQLTKGLRASAAVKKEIEKKCAESIIAASGIIAGAIKSNPPKKILLAGNGGSAADCQHLAAEFIIRLSSERNRRALPAIALTTDTSVITAGANDFGFETIFARQIEALGNEGDVLICFSTSGNSKNLVKAAETAKDKGMKIIGFLGKQSGLLGPLTDISINIPSTDTPRIQEGHITVGHIMVGMVETLLFDGDRD
ncbi:SIS domain-containing protein [bacterium]|nr:SIS domain-containing protein [bacterium]